MSITALHGFGQRLGTLGRGEVAPEFGKGTVFSHMARVGREPVVKIGVFRMRGIGVVHARKPQRCLFANRIHARSKSRASRKVTKARAIWRSTMFREISSFSAISF
ncbi:hypothetical protein D3C77_653050 [compost metagenome]